MIDVLQDDFEFADPGELSGMRLQYLEMYNWGTFDNQIVRFDLDGQSGLLSGDNGTGKSTIVDAITTIFYRSDLAKYNSSAGSRKRERKLADYFYGVHNTTTSSEDEYLANTVQHREGRHVTILTAHFENIGFLEAYTLGVILYKSTETSEDIQKRYVISDNYPLTVEKMIDSEMENSRDFLNHVRNISNKITVFDSFQNYSDAYLMRFHFGSKQPIELFHQTVSMKEIDNFTHFIRQHMLEYYDPAEEIDELYEEYEQLEKIYLDIQRIEHQIEDLSNIEQNHSKYLTLRERIAEVSSELDAIDEYFARLEQEKRTELLSSANSRLKSIENLINETAASLEYSQRQLRSVEDQIAINGGNRIGEMERELQWQNEELQRRRKTHTRIARCFKEGGLSVPSDSDQFEKAQQAVAKTMKELLSSVHEMDDQLSELESNRKPIMKAIHETETEIEALRSGHGNIPRRFREIRADLCEDLNLGQDSIPFIAELIAVKEAESEWEGAIEKLLAPVSLILLVPMEIQSDVENWLHGHYLGRLIQAAVMKEVNESLFADIHPGSILTKLDFQEEHPYSEWLRAHLQSRFPHIACDSMTMFQRERFALAKSGLIKAQGVRLRKDDRTRIDDRSAYLLGWDNSKKIAALEIEGQAHFARLQELAEHIEHLKHRRDQLRIRQQALAGINHISEYSEMDWHTTAERIEDINSALVRLQSSSDILNDLTNQKAQIEESIKSLQAKNNQSFSDKGRIEKEIQDQTDQLLILEEMLKLSSRISEKEVRNLKDRIDQLVARSDSGIDSISTPDDIRACKDALRKSILASLSNYRGDEKRLETEILLAMSSFRTKYPDSSYDFGTEIVSASEYVDLYEVLRKENLPKHKQKFRELLHQGTIQRVVTFNANLDEQKRNIQKGIQKINDSMRTIDFDPGVFIQLKGISTNVMETKEFVSRLRHAASNTIGGEDNEIFSEEKFHEVRNLIQELKDNPEWARRVCDVRNWHIYHIEAIRREDNSAVGTFVDSSGKSGGEKEKFAYTILAASLAYQYGMEVGVKKSRAFHFTVIDEAFQRASDETTRYGMNLFKQFDLQLLLVTPNKGIPVIEKYVSKVGITVKDDFNVSSLHVLDVSEYDRIRTEQKRQKKARFDSNVKGVIESQDKETE
jgi:uncharacterized protein YPO0396